jgi:hypothetical protein
MSGYKINLLIVFVATMLFILLSPGILFTIPSRKKKTKNTMDRLASKKTQIIITHSMLYTVALLILYFYIEKNDLPSYYLRY